MGLYVDTADLETIRRAEQTLPLAGLTTNPSIHVKIAQANREAGKAHLDDHAFLHEALAAVSGVVFMQVTGASAEEMQAQAERYLAQDKTRVVLKIPANAEGLRLARWAKGQGYKAAFTAVYSVAQVYMSGIANADFAIFYFDRMRRLGVDVEARVREMSSLLRQNGFTTRLMAASLKTTADVEAAFCCGAQDITADLPVLEHLIHDPLTDQAVEVFTKDWQTYTRML